MVEQRNRVDRSREEEGGEKGAATATTLKHLCFSVCIYSSWATSGRIGQKKKKKSKASLDHSHRNRKHRQLQPSTSEPSVSIKKTCLF